MEIPRILYEIIGDKAVLDPSCELLDSGLLDSLALMELVDRLEDEGVTLHPTQIDRERLRTPTQIAALVEELR